MQVSSRKSEIVKAYKSADNFLKLFNPDKTPIYAKSEKQCFMGKAPSMNGLAEAFGNKVTESWLIAQLTKTILLSGCTPPEASLVDYAARSIISSYGTLKVTEVMVFLNRFAAGEYGHFYGGIDFQMLAASLNDFCKNYRPQKLNEYLQEEETKRLQEYEKAIKEGRTMNYKQWQEYKQKHKVEYGKDNDGGRTDKETEQATGQAKESKD